MCENPMNDRVYVIGNDCKLFTYKQFLFKVFMQGNIQADLHRFPSDFKYFSTFEFFVLFVCMFKHSVLQTRPSTEKRMLETLFCLYYLRIMH